MADNPLANNQAQVMALLFIFITTLLITYTVDNYDADVIAELVETMQGVISFEWLVVPALIVILSSLCYYLFYKLNDWIVSRQI